MESTKSPLIKYSEIFYSLQGEGRFVGVPSVFLRTFGCNFTCSGFSQPRDRSRWVPEEEMPHVRQPLDGVSSLNELPVVPIGCDSSASWSPRYRHLAPAVDVPTLVARLHEAAPFSAPWRSLRGEDIHLVITGGEPLLGWQRAYVELFAHPGMSSLRNLTFETNGTQALAPAFKRALTSRGSPGELPGFHLNWSVSPKLSLSGERWEDAIRPEIIKEYADCPDSFIALKFVVRDGLDFEEIQRAVDAYRGAGAQIDAIYAMPEGAVEEDYREKRSRVAELCMKHGYMYSPRLHVDLFGNRFGT